MKRIIIGLFIPALVMLMANCQQSTKETTPTDISKTNIEAARALLQKQAAGKTADLGKEKLSEYGFFDGDLKDLKPNEDVIPYDLLCGFNKKVLSGVDSLFKWFCVLLNTHG